MRKLLLLAFTILSINVFGECKNRDVISSSYEELQYSLMMLQMNDKTNDEILIKGLKNDFKSIYRKELSKKQVYRIIDKYEDKPEVILYYHCDGELLRIKAFVLFDLMLNCGYYDYRSEY